MRMNSPVIFWLIAGFYLCSGFAHAEVYRWVNDRGETVFGDSPPKGTQADVVPVDTTVGRGMKFATPKQVEQFHNEAQTQKKARSQSGVSSPSKSYCRRYQSDLNKIEIYLQHTYSIKDAEKARDLRKLIRRECSGVHLTAEDNRSRCNSYHQDMVKTEIYLEHTPNPRDKQKLKDLRKQIARECE